MTRGFTIIVRDPRFLGSFSRSNTIEALAKVKELSDGGAKEIVVRDDGGKELRLQDFEQAYAK
jgi:hypothetical protein